MVCLINKRLGNTPPHKGYAVLNLSPVIEAVGVTIMWVMIVTPTALITELKQTATFSLQKKYFTEILTLGVTGYFGVIRSSTNNVDKKPQSSGVLTARPHQGSHNSE